MASDVVATEARRERPTPAAGGRHRRDAAAGHPDRTRRAATELVGFLLVGSSGVVVNTATLWVIETHVEVPYLVASAIATQVAVGWNFLLLQRTVFGDRRQRTGPAFARFWLVNAALLPCQLALLAIGVELAGLQPVVANVIVLGVVFALRFGLSSGWAFAAPGSPGGIGAGNAVDLLGPGARFVLRIGAPPLLTALAFPSLVADVGTRLADGGPGAVAAAAVLLAAGVIAWTRLRPPAADADVHDRQVDVILGVSSLGVAGWLGVPALDRSHPQLIAAGFFLLGACLLVLGTRLTARLRVPLALAAGAPIVAGADGAVALVATTVAALLAAGTVRRHRRRLATLAGSPGPVSPVFAQQLPACAGAILALIGAAALLALTVLAPDLGRAGDPGDAERRPSASADVVAVADRGGR